MMTETYAASSSREEHEAFRKDMDARAVRSIIDGTVYNGGATVSLLGAHVPDAGFMVGGIVEPATYRGWIAEVDVQSFIDSNRTRLNVGRRFLGSWYDKESDSVWLDVSDWHASREIALGIARGRGEIAVYDLATGESIKVEGE